jgi:type IV pilus assembly protein PilA
MKKLIEPRDDRGFTLIELMVVVLIIAILIAIAIPTFLGAQDRARDRAAQSDLRNSLTAAKTLATDHDGYFLNDADSEIVPGDMPELEPAITFTQVVADIEDNERVLLNTHATGDYITFVKKSASDTYFGITVDRDGIVGYCSSDVNAAACDDGGVDAASFSTEGW